MTCEHFTEVLQSYLDGELDSLPHAAIEHTHACRRCQRLGDELIRIRQIAGDLAACRLSRKGEQAIIGRVQRRIAAVQKRPAMGVLSWLPTQRWRPALGIAMVLLILIATYFTFFYRSGQEHTAFRPEDEIEVLLQEHTVQMESNLLQPAPLPSRVVTTVAGSFQ